MTSPLHFSSAAALGLHAAAYLADREGGLCQERDMSGALGVSHDHLVKVLQKMARRGLVETARGPKGGVRLAREAESIRLMEVYEAVEGRYTPVGCLLRKRVCDGLHCVLGGLAKKLNREIHDYLAGTRVSSFAAATGKKPPGTGVSGAGAGAGSRKQVNGRGRKPGKGR